MRLVIDTLVALMLAGLLGGLVLHDRQAEQSDEDLHLLRSELRRIEQQVAYHTAVVDVPMTGRGFPTTIDPEWFGGLLPKNTLVRDDRPWLELATAEQADLAHPPIRVLLDQTYASFWYNPYQGVVRARVPADVSDEKALGDYNSANGCDETVLIDQRSLRQIAAQTP
ncbi:MAG: hypothetical protein KAS72_15675 [Phycisphaerales bacterium]|nr:hypothetical protein [Phycisphaerales bacterium]